jgi:sugar phosphate permease
VSRYRWVVLALGIGAQAAFAAVMAGLPAIGPALRGAYDLSLAGFGAVLGAFTLGATAALVPWGIVTDRLGERLTLSLGVGGCGLAMYVATLDGRGVLVASLVAAGALGAVANVASGSAVTGWFAPSERGTALGLRQAAVPLGGAIAALALPSIAESRGPRTAMVALAIGCAAASLACAAWVRSPSTARPERGVGPLRDRRIWRLAGGSALMITAQIAVAGFLVVYLHDERGFSGVAAGVVLAAVQVAGIIGRVAVGRWSDRLVLRVAPLRRIAVATAVAWAVVPLLLDAGDPIAVASLVVGGALASSWNGLSFTAAAELATVGRSATAIALQQTALFATAAAAPPLFGALVEGVGWRPAFWALAVGPALAWWVLGPLARGETAPSVAPG